MARSFASEIDADACSVAAFHPDAVAPLLGRSLGSAWAGAGGELFATRAVPSRARILHQPAISDAELRAGDIALVLGMSLAALTHQLRSLRGRGAVERRKVGRLADDRLADDLLVDDHLREPVLGAATHVAERA